MMGGSLVLCCKAEEASKEEEITLGNRFEGLHTDGLVSIAQNTGDEDRGREATVESPRPQVKDDRGSATTLSSLPEKSAAADGSANLPSVPEKTFEGATKELANALHNPLLGLIPKGEYTTMEKGFPDVDALELANLERLVAKLAGSPLGCLDFETTFKTRQKENQIVVLKDHELDGATFGEVCGQYNKVTILGLQNAAGKVIWAPAPYIRLHSSDQIMLIECTPFAIAMGLVKEGSLAQSSLSPRSSAGLLTPGVQREQDMRDMNMQHDFPDKEKRRCCV